MLVDYDNDISDLKIKIANAALVPSNLAVHNQKFSLNSKGIFQN